MRSMEVFITGQPFSQRNVFSSAPQVSVLDPSLFFVILTVLDPGFQARYFSMTSNYVLELDNVRWLLKLDARKTACSVT